MPVSGDGILEATFDPAWAAVRLIVDGGMWPDPVDAVTIIRSVAGTADVPVRGVEDLAVVGGTFVGTDHEMPLDSTVTYTVTGYFEGAVVDTATVAESTTGAADGLWLKAPGEADLTVHAFLRPVEAILSPTIGGVYRIAGGGGSVAQTTAQWSGVDTDQAAVTVAVEHPSGTARLKALMSEGRVLLLQPLGGSDLDAGWYYVSQVSRRNPSRMAAGLQRDFDLTVQRTGMPAGTGRVVSGTTWAGLMDEQATSADVLTAYDTWFDVVRGA